MLFLHFFSDTHLKPAYGKHRLRRLIVCRILENAGFETSTAGQQSVRYQSAITSAPCGRSFLRRNGLLPDLATVCCAGTACWPTASS
jgi:hypothetical protein